MRLSLKPGLWFVISACIQVVTAAISSQECTRGPSPCFSYSYEACSPDEIKSRDPSPVHITLLTPETADWQIPFLQSILTLLCTEILPDTGRSGNQSTPYCWRVASSVAVACDPGCNCTDTAIVVFDRQSQRVISSLSVAAVLNEDSSKVALHFAGFSVVSVNTEEGSTDDLDLFDVPIISWVCVGLGVVVALLVLFKPAWWDRLIMEMCVAKLKKCSSGRSENFTPIGKNTNSNLESVT